MGRGKGEGGKGVGRGHGFHGKVFGVGDKKQPRYTHKQFIHTHTGHIIANI
jgi:hypothetical protein